MLTPVDCDELADRRPRMTYLSPVEWSSLWQRPQQVASQLASRYRLTYIDPVGLRNVRLSDMRRIRQRIISAGEDSPNCSVIRPRYIPVHGIPGLDGLNRWWLKRQLAKLLIPTTNGSVLWIGTPSLLAEMLLDEQVADTVVYDCMDHYAAFHRGACRRRIERTEERIVSRADLVFASSKNLVRRLSTDHTRVLLAPNGVDLETFRREAVDRTPAWRSTVQGPVVGYYGTLGNWLDYPLLEQLARSRPDWTFVLIGTPETGRVRRLFSLKNVIFPGAVPYHDLPAHAAAFDVALVPFELNEVTRCVHPIKALEYLALGLPTVASRIPDLENLSHVIQFASGVEEWKRAIERALDSASQTASRRELRRAAIAGLSWDALTERMEDCLRRPRLDLQLAARPRFVADQRGPQLESAKAA